MKLLQVHFCRWPLISDEQRWVNIFLFVSQTFGILEYIYDSVLDKLEDWGVEGLFCYHKFSKYSKLK